MEHRKSRDPENQLVQAGLLMDTYGTLLTERQRQFMRMHYEEDLSFSEIAREFKISRQAVHDSVKHATESLHQFEQVLGLVEKMQTSGETRIGGRQLIERLEKLCQRVQGEGNIANPEWIVEELTSLIGLLRGGEEAREAGQEGADRADKALHEVALVEDSPVEETAEPVATPEPETVREDPTELHEAGEMSPGEGDSTTKLPAEESSPE